jgi:hypothetical protein
MIGEYLSPSAMVMQLRGGDGVSYAVAAPSLTVSAGAGLIGPQGPILTGPAPSPLPMLDRASLVNMTMPPDEEKKIPPTMIAAGLVALGVAGLVFYKLRKKRG